MFTTRCGRRSSPPRADRHLPERHLPTLLPTRGGEPAGCCPTPTLVPFTPIGPGTTRRRPLGSLEARPPTLTRRQFEAITVTRRTTRTNRLLSVVQGVGVGDLQGLIDRIGLGYIDGAWRRVPAASRVAPRDPARRRLPSAFRCRLARRRTPRGDGLVIGGQWWLVVDRDTHAGLLGRWWRELFFSLPPPRLFDVTDRDFPDRWRSHQDSRTGGLNLSHDPWASR